MKRREKAEAVAGAEAGREGKGGDPGREAAGQPYSAFLEQGSLRGKRCGAVSRLSVSRWGP